MTLVLYLLIKSLSFFKNYRCGERAISLIGINFIIMICIMSTTGILCIMMARILDMFGNFSIAEFMSLGKWISRLGFMSKWGPWIVAILADCWLIVSFINTVWILAAPNDWCSRRWNAQAIVAVENCRLWYKGNVKCLSTEQNLQNSESGLVTTCNDGNELLAQKFLSFTPKEGSEDCSFQDLSVCRAYANLREGKSLDWNESPLNKCLGDAAVSPDSFHDSLSESSDLYRYLMIYVQGWTITLIGVVCFFIYTKLSGLEFRASHTPGELATAAVVAFAAGAAAAVADCVKINALSRGRERKNNSALQMREKGS
ncbi:hypothetical protein, conserved [Eimeria acervulina]|uniref:Uncharacterized protein n=1 Tax=Eimeria acervulina TaxID=5801 RepID=U6GNQ1_EIMAC|nr:hypothetical protein, conserved [Eimeria acervulina]CDI81197.1 hypothetical protein, conserved [Eimeria acervulina]